MSFPILAYKYQGIEMLMLKQSMSSIYGHEKTTVKPVLSSHSKIDKTQI